MMRVLSIVRMCRLQLVPCDDEYPYSPTGRVSLWAWAEPTASRNRVAQSRAVRLVTGTVLRRCCRSEQAP